MKSKVSCQWKLFIRLFWKNSSFLIFTDPLFKEISFSLKKMMNLLILQWISFTSNQMDSLNYITWDIPKRKEVCQRKIQYTLTSSINIKIILKYPRIHTYQLNWERLSDKFFLYCNCFCHYFINLFFGQFIFKIGV